MLLEIAVQDAAGARVAAAGGADQIELCSALRHTGGLTPSTGTVTAVLDAVRLPVHVLVRPRPGDFHYDAAELDTMLRDIRHLRGLGVAGVVIGALTAAGKPDVAALARLGEAAGHLQVTWHRMVDAAADPVAAVAAASAAGVTRVLTSGGAPRAGSGLATLAAMVAVAPGVGIVAGGGVRPDDIAALAGVGVQGVHLSAMRRFAGGPVGPGGGDRERDAVDPALVSAARTAVDAVTG